MISGSGDVEPLCALSVSVNGRLNVNVALNRPTYQSGMWDGHHGGLGNDGRNGTNLYDGPCACTDDLLNPWWSVDLGAPLYVAGVKYTSVDGWGKFVAIYCIFETKL